MSALRTNPYVWIGLGCLPLLAMLTGFGAGAVAACGVAIALLAAFTCAPSVPPPAAPESPAAPPPAIATIPSEERVRELEEAISKLRHDLNGILSPALLNADRLLANPDPTIRRIGEVVAATVDRAATRLAATRALGRDPEF